ncbi:MAG: DUF935 family protein, partial [Phycisphaerae bacterium]|nr:DUF935 family protein [Phycisphaerae bacterium]
MSLIQRIAHAVRRRAIPSAGALVAPLREDAWRLYPADGLTPQRLLNILRNADDGDLEEQMALYEQMEEKDAHLFSVAQTRRLAVTGLPWRIVPASSVDPLRFPDADAAARTSDYCAEALAALDDFDAVLAHLSLAVGRNIAVAELIWQAGPRGVRLAQIAPIPFLRLRIGRRGELRILTAEAPHEGIETPPDKFIIHQPHGPGRAARGGLLRVTAMAFLAKHYAMKDWLIFMEVFGMPVRIARYAPNATPDEKRELLNMLRRLGTDAAGIFSKSVDLEIKQTRVPGDVAPYESICHFFNREISKAWLGQTLTTDTARSLVTARSAADVHDRVRRDIRDADLRAEARTLRRDLLAP